MSTAIPKSVSKSNAESGCNSPPEGTKIKKLMYIEVVFLDNSTHVFETQSKSLGRTFFEKVCKLLNLIESDYFGLEYEDESNTKYWLDGLKPLCRQVGLTSPSPTMFFCVKFYPPDPVQLEDEYTRYLFGLQIKKDLSCGSLQCNDNTAAVMISYIVQADHGDYDPIECPDSTYLSLLKFVPNQDSELENKVMENHRKHVGQTPAEAELNLLETARRCELYGIKMTAAKDHDGVMLNIAVAHLGLLVFQNFTKINTFSWAKIRKLSFKRKRFLVKLHPEGYGLYKDTVEFFFNGRNECKNFWKKCIENHTFFRCSDAKKGMRQKPKFFSRGSSFRYSGRTQVQLSEYVRENYVKRNFQRSTSHRTNTSSPSRPAGTISPQPVLPVPTSLSNESVSADAVTPSSPSGKKPSVSEPTTPHTTANGTQGMANGSVLKHESNAQEGTPELTTPESDQAGYQTPEYLGQDTDDNISHDSYHLTDKEAHSFISESAGPHSPEGDIQGHQHLNGILPQVDGKDSVPGYSPTKEHFKRMDQIEDSSEILRTFKQIELQIRDPEVSPKYSLSVEGKKQVELQENVAEEKASRKFDRVEVNGHIIPEDSPNSGLEDISKSLSEAQQSFGVPPFHSETLWPAVEVSLHSHKKTPNDKEYFICKELLMTERTYRKDLQIIDVDFREKFLKQGDMPNDVVQLMLAAVDPLYEAHCSLLTELEQRIAFWEGKHVEVIKHGVKGVGDIMVQHKRISKLYGLYVDQLPQILKHLSDALQTSQRFAHFYQSFEKLKLCYLPLTTLLLRPLYRLFQYCSILTALMDSYGSLHFDYANCNDALVEFQQAFSDLQPKIPPLVNTVKEMELERSLAGFPSFAEDDRVFIREGCLQKLSKYGNHQCMVFLFSDVLLYTKQIQLGELLFKVHSCLSLCDLEVEETEPRRGANYCFIVHKGERCLLLAASSEKERGRWLKDLNEAIKLAKTKNSPASISSQFSSDETMNSDVDSLINESSEKPVMHHVNTSVHVCWHRNVSIGREDFLLSVKCTLSGLLLLKFKSSSEWQKLWVVVSNLCLFFYKTFMDENPLASLPLPGYRVLLPSAEDSITKDFVFKLQYKNHKYFFRSENQHVFDRWMDVIQHCTLSVEEKTRL